MFKRVEDWKRFFIYARVSKDEQKCPKCKTRLSRKAQCCRKCGEINIEYVQNPEVQLLPIRQFVERWNPARTSECIDRCSGEISRRPGFDQLLTRCRAGEVDVVVVFKYDRIFRNTIEALLIQKEFEDLRIDFVSVTEEIDLSTPTGKYAYQQLAIEAEHHQVALKERVRFGIQVARNNGKQIGRPRRIVDEDKLCWLYAEHRSLRIVAKLCGVARGTVATIIKKKKNDPDWGPLLSSTTLKPKPGSPVQGDLF